MCTKNPVCVPIYLLTDNMTSVCHSVHINKVECVTVRQCVSVHTFTSVRCWSACCLSRCTHALVSGVSEYFCLMGVHILQCHVCIQTPSLLLSVCLSLTYTLAVQLGRFFSLSLFLSFSLLLLLSFSLWLSHTHTCLHCCKVERHVSMSCRTHTLSLSHPQSASLTHTHSPAARQSETRLSLSVSLSQSLSLSLSLTRTHTRFCHFVTDAVKNTIHKYTYINRYVCV